MYYIEWGEKEIELLLEIYLECPEVKWLFSYAVDGSIQDNNKSFMKIKQFHMCQVTIFLIQRDGDIPLLTTTD